MEPGKQKTHKMLCHSRFFFSPANFHSSKHLGGTFIFSNQTCFVHANISQAPWCLGSFVLKWKYIYIKDVKIIKCGGGKRSPQKTSKQTTTYAHYETNIAGSDKILWENKSQIWLFSSTTTDYKNHLLPKCASPNLLFQVISRNTGREKLSGMKGFTTCHV